MENIAVIGIGALGRRHLQSLLELRDAYNIYGVEVNTESLLNLREEFKEVEFVDDIDKLPDQIEFCVISTSSNVRRTVTQQLLEHAKVRYILFEKILFQTIEDYAVVSELLKKKNCKAWVNCARREWSSYIKLKKELRGEKISTFTVSGSEWGLCCNGIHMIDLLLYLTDEADFTLAQSVFKPGIFESKRMGFKEIYGTIAGECGNGSFFQISCTQGTETPSLIMINGENKNILIDEGHKIYVSQRDEGWEWKSDDFLVEFQSQLTSKVAMEILETGECKLPDFEFSKKTHIQYINMWLNEFHRQGMEGDICPIT